MDLDKINKLYDIKKKMIDPEHEFLKEMQNYLGVPIFVYGSIFRLDYFPNKSDIDMSIFSDDVETTVKRLTDYLGISSSKMKIFKMKCVNKHNHKTKIIWGFKTNYRLDVSEFSRSNKKWYEFLYYPKIDKRFEIMIYNKK